MVKFHNKTILGLVILTMLTTSPMSVSYAFAENDEFEQKITKSPEMRTTIITEKLVDGKLELKQFLLPENLSKDDMNRMISFEKTTGWAYVNQKAYQSGIVLYDGKAIKMEKNQWKISEEKTFDSHDFTQKNSKSEEFGFQVVFSGKTIEAGSETFAVIFTNPSLKGPDSNLENLVQIAKNMASDSQTHSKEFRSSFLVG